MAEKIKKHQRVLLTALIAVCVGTILFSGVRYLARMQDKLEANERRHIMHMTLTQRQAVDDYIRADRERLHQYAEYLSQMPVTAPGVIMSWLKAFVEPNAVDYGVICFDEGLAYSSSSDRVIHLQEAQLQEYRALTGSGVRDGFTGIFSGEPRCSYYETFTFSNGHSGLIQKSYSRSALSGISSLSVYDGLGYGYILDSTGDILRRSAAGRADGIVYDNIFRALEDFDYAAQDIEALRAAFRAGETGSVILTTASGEQYVYSYIPLESAEGWYLLSAVSLDVISAEANGMLQDSQVAVWLLIVTLILCIGVFILIQYVSRDLAAKDQKIAYQAGLFDVFFDCISENTDDVYLLLDPACNRIEYSSPNLERVFGFSEEEMADAIRRFEATSTAGERVNLESLRGLQPGMGTGDVRVERVNRKTGEHRWFLDRTRCTQIQGVNKLICYSSDRTEERKTQDSITEALQMAKAASDAKSAFLSNVSHDIRTPMNAIIGFLALMKDEAENPAAVREYIQRIDTASQHLLELINDVLDMSKIESGSATLSISEMDLAELFGGIDAIIRPQAEAKNQSFAIVAGDLRHGRLLGDKMRINQILINLLSNAVKYTGEGGDIQLLVEELPQVVEDYSRIRFTVRDNGRGMSEAYQEVMFEPFTREEDKFTHEIQGTGLGMPITKRLVELMGGTIAVESRPGEGSTFLVELELQIQEQKTAVQNAGSPKQCGAVPEDMVRGMHILVVDDVEVNRIVLTKILTTLGAVCDTAANGQEAVEKFEASRPGEYDIIMMDVQMPVKNGYEATRAIRAGTHPSAQSVPIIAMTANAFVDDVREAIESGMNAHIAKPVQIDTLTTTIRQVLDSQAEKGTENG